MLALTPQVTREILFERVQFAMFFSACKPPTPPSGRALLLPRTPLGTSVLQTLPKLHTQVQKASVAPFKHPFLRITPDLTDTHPDIFRQQSAQPCWSQTQQNAIPCDVAYIPGCPFCYVCNQSLAVFNITRQNASNITWFTISPVKYVSKQHSCN